MNEKQQKILEIAKLLDAKKTGNESALLLKKINDLKDELKKLYELLGVVENKATEKTGEVLNTLNKTYSTLEGKINELSKQDLKLSKDTQYTQDYFKGELQTIKNTISNLKLQHGKDGRDGKNAEPIDTTTIAIEASKQALEAIKPLIPIVPTSDEIIAQIPVIGEKVRDSLELLQGEERLDAKAIKNLPATIQEGVKYYGGSGIKDIIGGSGITVDNTNLGYPVISAPGSTTDEKVKLNASDPTAGYLDAKLQEGIQAVQFDVTNTPTASAPGLIQWNQTDGTYDMGLLNSSVLQVGQETMFFGKASGAIANGDLVQFAGVEGDHIKIKKAVGSEIDANPHFLVGVATENIANGAFGYVTWFGKVNGVYTKTPANQDSVDWVAGDLLYFNVATGQLTKTFPTVPNRVIIVAAVIKAQTGSSESGIIIVRPTFGCKVTDLDDVNGTALTADGQIMTWHNTEGYFDFDKNINDYLKLDQTTPQTITASPIADWLTASKVVFTASDKKLTSTGIGTSAQFIKADGSLDSSTYLTAEADTLATVTARGATTATASSFTGGATIGTALTLTAGIDIRPSADSTTAINIAQANGTDFVTFDTTNARMGVGVTPTQKLDVNGNINIPLTASSTSGLIMKGGTRFIHNYGASNVFVGVSAGNTTFDVNYNFANVGIGAGALSALNGTSGFQGSFNFGLGASAGNGITTGYSNILIGNSAGTGITTTTYNTIIGDAAAYASTGLSGVVYIGRGAGRQINTFTDAVFIGTVSGGTQDGGTQSATGLTNVVALGARSAVGASHTIALGSVGTYATDIISGGTIASAKLHLIKTTEQLRLGYDASNYFSTTVGSTGSTTFALTGTTPTFTFSQGATFSAGITLSTQNIVTDTTTGTKIGTATTQKIGFFNATPVVQTTGIAALKVNYAAGDLDTEAEIITAINTTNTAINALRTALNALGLTSTV